MTSTLPHHVTSSDIDTHYRIYLYIHYQIQTVFSGISESPSCQTFTDTVAEYPLHLFCVAPRLCILCITLLRYAEQSDTNLLRRIICWYALDRTELPI